MTGAAPLAEIIAAAADLPEGAEIGDVLRQALFTIMAEKAGADAALLPKLGPLAVRREDTPDWWGRGNLMLASPGGKTLVSAGMSLSERTQNIAVVGAAATLARMSFPQENGLVVVGDGVDMPLCNLLAMNGGAVLIGEGCTASSWARVDARNGGLVLVGADGMWGGGVNLVTDDMHTIRDLQTGCRTNGFGGRIVVERHVWLSDGARLAGGARVGENAVVGYAAAVRSDIPAGAICIGTPARPIRLGVTWTREDAP